MKERKNIKMVLAVIFLMGSLAVFAMTDSNGNLVMESPNFSMIQKLPKPVIEYPKDQSQVSSEVDFQGTANRDNKVELHVVLHHKSGQMDMGVHTEYVNEKGQWILKDFVFWLPGNLDGPYFIIQAVQINSDGVRSDAAEIQVFPGEGVEVLQRVGTSKASGKLPRADRGGGEIILRDDWDKIKSSIQAPKIISPREGSRLAKGENIQLIGKGIPGYEMEIIGVLRYEKAGKYYLLDFELQAVVDEEGTWATQKFNPNLRKKAENVFYSFKIKQISPQGEKSSRLLLNFFQEN